MPDQLKQVLCHCLRKDPARRWQHISDVRLALEDVKAALERGPERVPKSNRRWLLALASLAGVALAATSYLAWKNSRAAPETGQWLFAQTTDDAGREVDPSLSADGKSILYPSRASGNWDLYLLRVGGKNPVSLTKDSASDETQAALSPDGERIAFRSERDGGGLFVMGATGESTRRLTDFCYLPAWSPDAGQPPRGGDLPGVVPGRPPDELQPPGPDGLHHRSGQAMAGAAASAGSRATAGRQLVLGERLGPRRD